MRSSQAIRAWEKKIGLAKTCGIPYACIMWDPSVWHGCILIEWTWLWFISLRVLLFYRVNRCHRIKLIQSKPNIWHFVWFYSNVEATWLKLILTLDWHHDHGSVLLHSIVLAEKLILSLTDLRPSVVGWFVIWVSHVLAHAFIVEALSVEGSVFELSGLALVPGDGYHWGGSLWRIHVQRLRGRGPRDSSPSGVSAPPLVSCKLLDIILMLLLLEPVKESKLLPPILLILHHDDFVPYSSKLNCVSKLELIPFTRFQVVISVRLHVPEH